MSPSLEAQAKQQYEAHAYEEAGRLYHQLWDERRDAFAGARYTHCLRKAGYPDAALRVARQVQGLHPDDTFVRRELLWALYDARFRPAKDQAQLTPLIEVGEEILSLTTEALPRQLVIFPILGLAKDKGRWQLVSEWCDRLDPAALSLEQREKGQRTILSEREQWYFAKVKSLIQLQQWDAARHHAEEAVRLFPRTSDFVRWRAQALAGQGHLAEAITTLTPLVHHERTRWYLLHELAEFKQQVGDHEEAYRLACRAALADGEASGKVRLFVMLGQFALERGEPRLAHSHAALARLIRHQEGWPIPPELAELEEDCRAALVPDETGDKATSDDVRTLLALCRRAWQAAVPSSPRRPVANPPVREGQTGHIKMYNAERGFGFITPDDGGEDLFFHIRAMQGGVIPTSGLAVSYQITQGRKGPNATEVTRREEEA